MQLGKAAVDDLARALSGSRNRRSDARLRKVKYLNDAAANTAERNLLRIAYEETYYYLENRKRIEKDVSFGLCQSEPLEKQLCIHSSLRTGDKLALKVVGGTLPGGKEVAIAIFRLKKPESEVFKTDKLLGLKPESYGWPQPECIVKARAAAAKALRRLNGETSARALNAIEKWEMLNSSTGELMLLMLCDGDRGRKAQADSCIRNIGGFFKELREVGEANGCGSEMAAADLPNAALLWPISPKKAYEIYRNAHRSARLFMGRWGHDYAEACRARAQGARVGEANAAMQMDAMLTQLEMAKKKYGTSRESLKIMNKASECLYRAFMEKPKWECGTVPEMDFVSAVAGGAARIRQIEAFVELDRCTRNPGFNPAMGKALRLMAANYMANYCAVWGREQELWNGLISNYHVRTCLQNSKNGHVIGDVKAFLANAAMEQEVLCRLDADARTAYRNEALHAARKGINLKIDAEIARLAKISPEIAEAIESARKKNFGHVNYKQGEKLCKDVRTAYLQPIQLAKYLKGRMPGEDIEKVKEAHFRANLMMFRMVSGSKEAAAAIIGDISPLLHVQTKGLDMESPAKKLIKGGFGGGRSNGTVSLVEKGAQKVRVTFEDHSIAFDYFAKAAADDRVSPTVAGTKDDPDVNLYGRKLSFSDLFPGEPEAKTPAELYSKFFRLASKDREKFDSIRQRIADADMSTAHYLSTYIDRAYNSGVVLMDGGRVAKNLPRKLATKPENTFMKYLMEEYPAFDADLAEVKDYVRQKIAIRVVDRLHARLPSYMRMYAESLANGAGKPVLP